MEWNIFAGSVRKRVLISVAYAENISKGFKVLAAQALVGVPRVDRGKGSHPRFL